MSEGGAADRYETAKEAELPVSAASIFSFTTRAHAFVLVPALVLTVLAGAIKPAITIFLGYIFDDLVSFSTGDATEAELLQKISIWCVALTGLGIATMLANGGFFSMWLVFGEMQAKSVRESAFKGMLEKEIEWYDLRADGIGSFLARIQT
jgi:ATP-binding cassette, subfamily B (MDR/TAP), member 1